jgi:hypothetical protein
MKNEIVVTQNDVTLRTIRGLEFTIGKNYYNIIREAITTSKRLYKLDKHNVIQMDLDSWEI